ncbi:hypothetical protein LINPERPRIM_LOCUS28689 [Linum perenne]
MGTEILKDTREVFFVLKRSQWIRTPSNFDHHDQTFYLIEKHKRKLLDERPRFNTCRWIQRHVNERQVTSLTSG